MISRPILFSAPMVRALLAGTKTQTRRYAKGQRELSCIHDFQIDRCPYGQVGHRLWVRESIRRQAHKWDHLPGGVKSYFVADGQETKADAWPWKRRLLPSIHCPRGLSRITLEITAVRVQRLQQISEDDAFAEGVSECGHNGYHTDQGTCSYRTLWEQINGPGSWALNPWVWALTFKRVLP